MTSIVNENIVLDAVVSVIAQVEEGVYTPLEWLRERPGMNVGTRSL